ncbi:hypothetical protein CHCC20348_0025 [Bacillus paralicheniformis]|nr:hypothetical protein CHCC20348_0025 [Bacillus paralicheniformis]
MLDRKKMMNDEDLWKMDPVSLKIVAAVAQLSSFIFSLLAFD